MTDAAEPMDEGAVTRGSPRLDLQIEPGGRRRWVVPRDVDLARIPLCATAIALLIALPREALAQPRCDARPRAILADLGLHVVNLGFQRTVNCHVTVQSSVGLYVPWTVTGDVLGLGGGVRDPSGETTAIAGFVVRARAFVHPLGAAPAGLWISPFAQVGAVRGARDGVGLLGAACAAGLSVGWNIPLGTRVLLGLGAGAQYHVVTFERSAAPPGFARFGPTVDINLGYTF